MSDTEEITNEQLLLMLSESTPDLLQQASERLSNEQIKLILTELGQEKDALWKEKTNALVRGLSEQQKLEAAGRALTPSQALAVCDPSLQIPFSPLLVGMGPNVFSELLIKASKAQMQLLKQEGVLEPIQHHLTVLSHEFNHFIDQLAETIATLEQEIMTLNITDLAHDDLNRFQDALDQLRKECKKELEKIDRSLAIAWNTDRLDIIEKLSSLKEKCQKFFVYGIGSPFHPDQPASGLYETLDKKLFSIYGEPENDVQALHDDDPAIEALIKFSLWYLKDYYELGLLPEIKSEEELDLNPEQHSEEERLTYRRKLFLMARDFLEKKGLSTVQDLKNARIFSKKGLQEFLDR